MVTVTPRKSNKPTSFHVVALNFIFIITLIIFHFTKPYIHELVYSFFQGQFLIISTILYFYFNALVRATSINHFSYLSLFLRIAVSTLMLAFVMICIAFITNTTEIIKREEFILFFINICLVNFLIMIISKKFYTLIKPKIKSKVILLTDTSDSIDLNLNYFADKSTSVKNFNTDEISLLIDYAVENGVEAVYISINSKNLNHLEPLIHDLSIYAFNLYWILPEAILNKNKYINAIKPILLNASPVNLDTNQYLLKRSLDVLGAFLILVILSPIAVLISLAIKLTDRGPVLYSQFRHGQYGKEFKMYKFRSMAVGSDFSDQQVFDNDPRVTSIGKLLRKTSIDELPQLLNIIKGEMSLVGPRPHIISESNLYSKKILRFLTRNQVKPGLTGLAQVRARGKTNSIELMHEKLESDLEYISDWSFYLDIKIIIKTPVSLWKNRHSNL